MSAARYQSPAFIVEFATRTEGELNTVIAARMRQLGIPEDMIGLRGLPGIEEGRAFVRFPDTQIGGNLNPAVNPAWRRGIALDHGVLDTAHPTMCNVPAWRQSTTVLRDRVDATIIHEYFEATLTPPPELTGVGRIDWLHKEAIRLAPDTTLPITERAREILRQYRVAEGQVAS
jgi:hypothetical protein